VVSPAIGELAAQLGEVVGLTRAECHVITVTATECLYHVVHPKVSRSCHWNSTPRVTGRLAGAGARGRWDEFVAVANDRSYWDGLVEHYPSLTGQLDRIMANRVAAVAEFAIRYAADKEAIGLGDLTGAAFGAGDSHRAAGQSPSSRPRRAAASTSRGRSPLTSPWRTYSLSCRQGSRRAAA
jgi:hypothetical protein